MSFDDRYHLIRELVWLQVGARASLLLVFVIGAPTVARWTVPNFASLAVLP